MRICGCWGCRGGPILLLALAAFGSLAAGCSGQERPYRHKSGLRLVPPPEWIERAREETLPQRFYKTKVPLPRLAASGKIRERLLVEYQRVKAGHHGWLRVVLAEPAMPLKEYLSAQTPGAGWKQEASLDALQIGGRPAFRVGFTGRWDEQDFICETVAFQQEANIYAITTSLPRGDTAAREQARQAVASVTWE